MRNILNWTLGGFFRSFGRILCYLLIGGLIGFILVSNDSKLPSWLKIMHVNASELVTTNLNKFYVRSCDANDTCDWSSSSDMGTAIPTGAVYLDGFRGRFGSNNKFTAGVKYRVKFNVAMTSATENSNCDIWYQKPREIYCSGSSTSSWSSDPDLIESCQYVSRSCYSAGGQIRAHYYYDIVPNTTIYGFQINTYFKDGYTFNVGGVNVMTSSSVSYDRDTTDAINNSTTTIINNNTENTQEIINQLQESATQTNDKLNDLMNSQNVCSQYDSINSPTIGYLNSSGEVINGSNYRVSDFIRIDKNTTIQIKNIDFNIGVRVCFYNINKSNLSCILDTSLTNNQFINIPTDASYVRFNIDTRTNKPQYDVCRNGNQALQDTLTDTNTSQDSSNASDFFHNFNLSIEGPISQIVLLPVNMLQYLIVDYNVDTTHSDLCTTFKGQTICLPSGDILWKRTGCHDNSPFGCPNYSAFRSFFQLVVGGFIYYKLCRRLVKSAEKGLDPQESGVNMLKL